VVKRALDLAPSAAIFRAKRAALAFGLVAATATACAPFGGLSGGVTTGGSPGMTSFRETAPPEWPEPEDGESRVGSLFRVGPSSLLPGQSPSQGQPGTPFVSPKGPLQASRYASLSPEQCLAEATSRKLPLVAATARDVVQPVRVSGPLGGVRFLMGGAKEPGGSSPHEILDCRLALVLADFGALLAPRGVVEVRHMSLYRPGARIAKTGHPSRHGQGLAIDVGQIVFADGKRWSVLDDWHGAIGDSVCGGAPRTVNEASAGLRGLVCETAGKGLFHLFLTPNHDRAHANHLHLDLEPGWSDVKVHLAPLRSREPRRDTGGDLR
jgi:hypothetical protein